MSIDILAVVIGAFIAIGADIVWNYFNNLKRRKHNASILLYDLISIKDYFQNGEIEGGKKIANLRYTTEWQSLVAECDFLKRNHVEFLYKVYDKVHDYNYLYDLNQTIANGRNGIFTSFIVPQNKLNFLIEHDDDWKSTIARLEQKANKYTQSRRELIT